MQKFFGFLCLLLFSSALSAQNFQSQLVFGINASQIDGDALWGYNKPGFLLGPLVAFPFSEKVSAQSGILYSQKGSRHGENDPVFFIQRLNYLEMPLLARFHAFEKIYFSAGATANYLINARIDDGRGFANNRTRFKDFDFCYTAGITYKPFDHTAFQIRIVNSLVSSYRLDYFKNRSLSFMALFDLGAP